MQDIVTDFFGEVMICFLQTEHKPSLPVKAIGVKKKTSIAHRLGKETAESAMETSLGYWRT